MRRLPAAALVVACVMLLTGQPVLSQEMEQEVAITVDKLRNALEEAQDLYARGKAAEAVPLLEEYLKHLAKDVDARALLGRALAALGRYDEAIEQLEVVTRTTPGDSDQWFRLGMVYDHARRPTDAVEAYDKAIELKPESPTVYYYKAQSLYYDLKRKDAAVTVMEKAVELDPTNDRAHKYLGSWYAYHGRFDDAEREIRKALELKPDDAQTQEMLRFIEENLRTPE